MDSWMYRREETRVSRNRWICHASKPCQEIPLETRSTPQEFDSGHLWKAKAIVKNQPVSSTQQNIGFLEDQLVSLDRYLLETYDYLKQELDIQRNLLAELEVSETFQEINKD